MIDPKKLRERRLAADLNPSQLAHEAGLARNVVHRLEDGTRGASVTLETAMRLAKALDCDVADLALDEFPEDPPASTPREKAPVSTTPDTEPDPEAWRWG